LNKPQSHESDLCSAIETLSKTVHQAEEAAFNKEK